MAIAIVRQVSGPEVAQKVADVLNLAGVRGGSERLTSSKDNVHGAKDDILNQARGEMLSNLDRPVSSEDLSRQLRISTRQLQRIFKARLNTNPRAYYVACRLDYARDLIQQTEMSVTGAAVAAGFVSLSHFSKCYRRRFGIHPRNDRQFQ
jgi:transcriptional regulator GlxA family with amidase domain